MKQNNRKTITMEKFILSQIEVDEINGMKLASLYVDFKGTEIPIVGKISDLSSMHVCYESKRPKELVPSGGVFQCHADINEFFGDMISIMFFLNNESVINDNSIFKAVEYICGEHIKNRTGKLIDSDLFSYVDLTIMAKYIIWTKFNNYNITQDESQKLWIDLKNHVLKVCENYVYLTKYDMSDLMRPKPYLVKYKN